MKTSSIRIVSLVGCACLAAPALAQNNRGNDSSSSRSGRSPATAHERSATSGTEHVRVTRATNFLGSDVIATDGKKVGDIVDFYLNLGDTPAWNMWSS